MVAFGAYTLVEFLVGGPTAVSWNITRSDAVNTSKKAVSGTEAIRKKRTPYCH